LEEEWIDRMGLKKCPYCQSIIDDKIEYCSNCGTQLLFPEDESMEEDIPGDKIIDQDDK
jgi:DNA-directed RNA polymerase subunit RPC12/RpoP